MVEKACKDAQHNQANLTEQACAIGPPKERVDRDFRKQTSMTIRTLLLENALMAFVVALCAHLPSKVSLDCLLRILFERSGTRMETVSQVVYWVNTAGVSLPYRRLPAEIVEGLSPWSYGIKANRFVCISKTCRLEAPPCMGSSNVHF